MIPSQIEPIINAANAANLAQQAAWLSAMFSVVILGVVLVIGIMVSWVAYQIYHEHMIYQQIIGMIEEIGDHLKQTNPESENKP
jgi:predicted negative regulator of RcsB-dependent stress response